MDALASRIISCQQGREYIDSQSIKLARAIISDGDKFGLFSMGASDAQRKCMGLYLLCAGQMGMSVSFALGDSDKYVPCILGAIAEKTEYYLQVQGGLYDVKVHIFWNLGESEALLAWGPEYYTAELGFAYRDGGIAGAERKHYEILQR